MTGLSGYGNYLYLASRSQNRTYRYVLPGIAGQVSCNPFNGYSQTRDIAWLDDNTVWVASDWSSVTLRCYNSSGTWTDYIDASLVPAARGVAVDPEGCLWVSDMVNDKIYKVDLSEGIGSGETGGTISLSTSGNPFSASVVISADGFSGTANLEIYDIRGTVVHTDDFTGSYSWNGASLSGTPVPSGAYFAFVSDGEGNIGSVELLKI